MMTMTSSEERREAAERLREYGRDVLLALADLIDPEGDEDGSE